MIHTSFHPIENLNTIEKCHVISRLLYFYNNGHDLCIYMHLKKLSQNIQIHIIRYVQDLLKRC